MAHHGKELGLRQVRRLGRGARHLCLRGLLLQLLVGLLQLFGERLRFFGLRFELQCLLLQFLRKLREPFGVPLGFFPSRRFRGEHARLLLGVAPRGQIPCDLREAEERSVLIMERSDDDVRPEPCSVFAHAPAFILDAP